MEAAEAVGQDAAGEVGAQLALDVDRSNKAIEGAQIAFEYLDRGGNALEDFPHGLTGEFDFEAGVYLPLAAAGETVELGTHAAFAPRETDSIRFEVRSLEFTDGSTWEAPAR